MGRSLLIIGAGVYGLVAKEIADSMQCFDKISFIDDRAQSTPNGLSVIGTVQDLPNLLQEYDSALVAIGNAKLRGDLLRVVSALGYDVAILISPLAYVSSSVKVGRGSIIEPMAVLHTGVVLGDGCLISAGAVVNHCCVLEPYVHVDCNGTVSGYSRVPCATKVHSGEVFQGGDVSPSEVYASINFVK